ncbi:MAG: hypothetical protein K2L12_03960 [Clostridia bacterium]|nr:hypothetical protein [Clostridia bacterium]
MRGCPYSEWSWAKDCEVCKATPADKPTHGAVKCDFGYEDCTEYKAKNQKSKPKEQP